MCCAVLLAEMDLSSMNRFDSVRKFNTVNPAISNPVVKKWVKHSDRIFFDGSVYHVNSQYTCGLDHAAAVNNKLEAGGCQAFSDVK